MFTPAGQLCIAGLVVIAAVVVVVVVVVVTATGVPNDISQKLPNKKKIWNNL